MKQNPYSHLQWKELIPDIEEVVQKMNRIPIVSVGITPYTRITPCFFLDNYSIFAVRRSSDATIMESYVNMYVFEDHYPDVANRVHGTGYLINSKGFQNFIYSQKQKPALMINTPSDKLIQDLQRYRLSWIGNTPQSFADVAHKSNFRNLVENLGLPSLPTTTISRSEFLASSFETLWQEQKGAFVVQRGDKEVGGNEGTFFIKTSEDFGNCISILTKDETFEKIIISPFIEGYSTSMLGCITDKGVLTGPLQLQLIDIPESLQESSPNGIFFGNDLGFRDWSRETELTAQKIVEGIGEHMAKQGYKGIFGIDFLYDKERGEIFPNECNPRFTGSLLLYSLALLEAGLPPMEFFHLLAHLNIQSSFDFDSVNEKLKLRSNFSHISFSPKGITKMGLPLLAGVYQYNNEEKALKYKGWGISLADLKEKDDFLVIDTVPHQNGHVEQNVPRLFKLIFPQSIGKSTNQIEERAGFLVDKFAKALIKASN